MGKTTKVFLLFIVCIFAISNITSSIPLVSAQLIYDGHLKTSYAPYFEFSLENGATLYDLGNYNIAFRAGVGGPTNSITFGAAIYSLSYKASWENKIHVIHQWSINDPADLEDDDPNPMAVIFHAIDLTNVPQGSHQIRITVDGGGYVGFGFYYTYSSTGSTTFQFSIVAPPSPTPSPAPANSLPTWNTQTIDVRGAGGSVFTSPLISLDSNNTPHVAYSWRDIEKPARWLTYASWNGFNWSFQTVDIGTPHSLIIDGNNKPHLVYGGISYATLEGSNWITQRIDEGGFGVVALDSLNKPHIAYNNGIDVKYAIQTESGWEIQTIDSIDSEYTVPFQVSLAIDKNNNSHILYGFRSYYEDKNTGENYPTYTIKLAVYKNSKWNIEVIPLTHPINGFGNMALDSEGYPHFICSQRQIQSTNPHLNNLLHASWNGLNWKTQTVVSGNIEHPGFLALDSFDYPHISYVDGLELMYAGWTGAEWNIQTVYADLPAHDPTYMALDSNRIPHISFRANPPGEGLFSRINYMMYAVASEPVLLASPLLIALPLLLVVTAVAIISAAVIAYLWRKK